MKHLLLAATMFTVLFSLQIVAANADTGFQPLTKFSRKYDFPNNHRQAFSTNDDPINNFSRTKQMRKARDARRNPHNRKAAATNVNADDRTQSETKLSSPDRQGRRQRTNAYRSAQRNNVTMLRDSIAKGADIIKGAND